jgi:hypothetical protein
LHLVLSTSVHMSLIFLTYSYWSAYNRNLFHPRFLLHLTLSTSTYILSFTVPIESHWKDVFPLPNAGHNWRPTWVWIYFLPAGQALLNQSQSENYIKDHISSVRNITTYNYVIFHRSFGGRYCLHHQGWSESRVNSQVTEHFSIRAIYTLISFCWVFYLFTFYPPKRLWTSMQLRCCVRK